MLIKDFFSLCKAGVTKQFALDEESMFAFLNLGMTELYKKFDLASREQIIELSATRKEYRLLADVMQVTAVYTDAKFLRETTLPITEYPVNSEVVAVPLNDDSNPLSVYTPSTGVLLVPHPHDTQILSVLYKSSPYVYTPEDLNSELDIEPQYITPLVLYISYSANLGLESVPGQIMSTFAMFNQACVEIENCGLNPTSAVTNNKLSMRGFV